MALTDLCFYYFKGFQFKGHEMFFSVFWEWNCAVTVSQYEPNYTSESLLYMKTILLGVCHILQHNRYQSLDECSVGKSFDYTVRNRMVSCLTSHVCDIKVVQNVWYSEEHLQSRAINSFITHNPLPVIHMSIQKVTVVTHAHTHSVGIWCLTN